MENIKHTISAIVLTRNEQDHIGGCLESISWVDELVVIDNASTDKTVQIAKTHGAKVIVAKEKDFSILRTIGLRHATGEWIVYVDADERVTPALKEELLRIVKSEHTNQPKGYYMKRNNFYLGKRWPCQDKMQRFFYRKSLKSWFGALHETAIVDGDVGVLHAPLDHFTHRTLEEMVAKTNVWSVSEARLRFQGGHPPIVWWRLLRVMMTGFGDSFFRQGGWRAGTVGWIESIYQGFSMFITYAKLWEMQQGDKTR
ncbi:hypothetical protein A2Z00_04540 [Candidatus Gottesmanbacteria bacterium RBG_13_45_10]|uniref:Glycosyltransferase 2-like domain-containing protein n=1 Tax=Candidatus Gottesmanbacteria bacterium RBG_13_45_10 TaxID=1798370 RepID=A0A1F5ZH01_9BACT|nr:MAG: hypothetical protein A2Z00_04540 [Candidatus Gottesmanbacteria bacterium RBG_13_45_10]